MEHSRRPGNGGWGRKVASELLKLGKNNETCAIGSKCYHIIGLYHRWMVMKPIVGV